ncbi:hypothetical protein [Nocardioides plantarum]|uniref:Uncharacterized protein n=1 Tax=Nocardioides plantarum TaxID=29299 RepID=A0ABV5K7N6_9ACTN|nr:hypothetical protein [Nocardioides plantarum]
MRDEPVDEFDEDYAPDDDSPPFWFNGQHLPEEARTMGLTQHVPDGALLDFAGSLDGAKPLHRLTAWVLLVVFGLPVVFALMRLWYAFV